MKHLNLIFALAFLCTLSHSYAQSAENIYQELDGEGRLIIHYDLVAEADETYTVSAFLMQPGQPGTRVSARSFTGDAGEGISPGERKKIVWDWQKDFPTAREDKEYIVVLEVEAEGGGFPWLIVVGGLGAAGAAAAVLLGGGDDGGDPGGGGNTTPDDWQNPPDPPGSR